jgi:aldehyde:ferredoxin oxidoreductase
LKGYNGKILRVNLTTGTLTDEALDEKMCRQHLGGAGFVAYYLMKEVNPILIRLARKTSSCS